MGKKNVEITKQRSDLQNEKENSNDGFKAEREELIELRREVTEYEVEFKGLKNQEVTIKKLNLKVEEMEKESQLKLEKALEEAHQKLAKTEGRRTADALEREAIMER